MRAFTKAKRCFALEPGDVVQVLCHWAASERSYFLVKVRLCPFLALGATFLAGAGREVKAQLAHAPAAVPAPAVEHLNTSYPVPAPVDVSNFGAPIARSLRLMATSTPEHRHRVRVLFYGQSITEQNWSRLVADDLRRRFPCADFDIQNRAIGGFASQLLHKTAYFDLYPFYPDLVIFHVYGSHYDYETIIRELRTRTTADILLQTDHVIRDEELNEETDPAKLRIDNWSPWWNHLFLPSMAARYNTELADVHDAWKDYLRAQGVHASQLLADGVHLNDWGNSVMAQLVERYLRYDPKFSPANTVRDYVVGRDVKWHHGRLVLPFLGNRVDVVAASSPKKNGMNTAQVRIDGKSPSAFPELYVFSRPSGTANIHWPGVIFLRSKAPLQVEEWTATLHTISPDASHFFFDLVGSQTGPDGTGTSDQPFVSKSRRIVIAPEDWWPHHDWELSKKPTPEGFRIKWRVAAQFTDEYVAPTITDPTREWATTLAQGLHNGPHTLELVGDPKRTPIAVVRVYTPPLPEDAPPLYHP